MQLYQMVVLHANIYAGIFPFEVPFGSLDHAGSLRGAFAARLREVLSGLASRG
jgi:hypothetical protein